MKRKEKKQLAEKIAKYERIVQNSTDKKEIKQAQNKIVELSSHVETIEDIVDIDEMVQDLLKQST
jgi:hypothetical protein